MLPHSAPPAGRSVASMKTPSFRRSSFSRVPALTRCGAMMPITATNPATITQRNTASSVMPLSSQP